MSTYDPHVFIDAVKRKIGNKRIICPYCGGDKFNSTEYVASILIGTDYEGVSIGPTIPSGMLICENCGRVEFFALGALGLMNKEGK